MTKRKDRDHARPTQEEERQATMQETVAQAVTAKADADKELKRSFTLWVGERADGTWSVLIGQDGKPEQAKPWKIRRLFQRDYQRAIDQLHRFVIGGAVRSIGGGGG